MKGVYEAHLKPSLMMVDDEAPIPTNLALIFRELGHPVLWSRNPLCDRSNA